MKRRWEHVDAMCKWALTSKAVIFEIYFTVDLLQAPQNFSQTFLPVAVSHQGFSSLEELNLRHPAWLAVFKQGCITEIYYYCEWLSDTLNKYREAPYILRHAREWWPPTRRVISWQSFLWLGIDLTSFEGPFYRKLWQTLVKLTANLIPSMSNKILSAWNTSDIKDLNDNLQSRLTRGPET